MSSLRTSRTPSVRELETALADQNIRVAYQPKLCAKSMRPVAFEALARWRLADGRDIPPVEFVTLAEENGLIGALTAQVVEQAVRWIAQLKNGVTPTICINISSASADDPVFVPTVTALCEKYGVSPEHVIFELNETRASLDVTKGLDFVTRLRLNGFNVAIDDVGTGHSAFLRLHELPFTEMKIDRQLVASVRHSLRLKVILENLVELGHSLDLLVVAEGIETEEGLDFVRDTGCDLIQGYYISPPCEADDAARWYHAHTGDALRH